MFDSLATTLIFLAVIHSAFCLIPAKFQWKTMDWNWEGNRREKALAEGSFVPEHNMPFGLARWRNKLFITIPRWKKGVAASLNYVTLDGGEQQPLEPYPSWHDAFIGADARYGLTNNTVVCAFRVCVDRREQLWVVDNGVVDMANKAESVSPPAILVFDLLSDELIHKYVIDAELLGQYSVLTSIVVDDVGDSEDAFAYVMDMGSNAVLVYSRREGTAWRLEHPYFSFDGAAASNVGGVELYWSDGVPSATLSAPDEYGFSYLYLHPASSTKQLKISSRVLKNKNATKQELMTAVEIVGDGGQVTACAMDPSSNILFFTQLNMNGVSCWNADKPFVDKNTPLIASYSNLLEFPSDIKIDDEKNLWILSNRQTRFMYELYDTMDYNNQVNFKVMAAPLDAMVEGSTCILTPLGKETTEVSLKFLISNYNNSTTQPK